MSYDSTKWGTNFPAQVNGINRPTAAQPNTNAFDTTDLPQYITADPVNAANLNAYLSQLLANDQRINDSLANYIPSSQTASLDDIDNMFNPDKVFTSTFDGVNYTGVRSNDSTGLNFSVSSDVTEGVDDFRNYDPFNVIEALSLPDGYGNSKIIAYQGDGLFDKYKNDPDFGADVLVGFPKGYMYNYIDSNNIITKSTSASYQPNFIPSPMHLRGNKLYNYVYMTKYGWCDDGKGGICSRSGYPMKINITENQFETLSRTKGFTVMGINEVSWLQHLGCIKYNSLNWQTTIGQGVSNTYLAQTATVSETAVSRIILSNADAASFAVGNHVIISVTSGTHNIITAIDSYDSNNMAITVNATTTFNTVSGSTQLIIDTMYSGNADSVLGLDGEISTGTSTKRSVLTFGLENLYSNVWKLLSGACFTDNNTLYLNSNTDTQYLWPTSAADAVNKGWSKYNANIAQTSGYISTFGYDTNYPYLSIPSATTGTSTAVGDYLYNTTFTSPHIVMFGGNLSNGSNDGPFYLYLSSSVSVAAWSFGAFGVFVPDL
jgi:hypothetical protein